MDAHGAAARWDWREPPGPPDEELRAPAVSQARDDSACSSYSYSEAPTPQLSAATSYSSYSTYSSYTSYSYSTTGLTEGGSSCSRSRGCTEKHRRKRPREVGGYGVESVRVAEEDIPFLLGKGGRTLVKVGKAAGCVTELVQDSDVVEIRGNLSERGVAKRFLRSMVAKRRDCIKAEDELAAGHCTAVPVRSKAVGLVVGKGGSFLRSLEEQFGALLMMASDPAQPPGSGSHETVIILGDRRARRAAQLSVMSTVETRFPGEFTEATRKFGRTYDEEDQDGDWGTCTAEFTPDDIAFALGKKGLTRRKLERSSNCIVQFVHNTAFVTGFRADRARAKDYIGWLFDQLDGPMNVSIKGRRDVSVLDVPQDGVGYVTGSRRETLTRLEAEFGVLTFFTARRKADLGLTQRLLVFGPPRSRMGHTLEVMRLVENACPGYFSRGVQNKISERKKLDTERMAVSEDMIPRLMGKHGETVKLMAVASGALLQYIGGVCWVAGTLDERRRCLNYVRWVRDQVFGRITIDTRGMSDVTEVHLPAKVAEWVTGSHCQELRRVERETQCLLILAYDHTGGRRLCIMSHVEGDRFNNTGRMKAEQKVNQLIHAKLREYAERHKGDGQAIEAVEDAKPDTVMQAIADGHSDTESDASDWNKVDWDS